MDARSLRGVPPISRRRALMPQAPHDAFSATVLDTVLLNRFPYLTGWGWESAADRARRARCARTRRVRIARCADAVRRRTATRRACGGVVSGRAADVARRTARASGFASSDRLFAGARQRRAGRSARDHLSCHDLNLARRFSTHALLLDGHGNVHAGRVRDVLTPERASAAFGYPLALIRDGAHEVLVPSIPPLKDTP